MLTTTIYENIALLKDLKEKQLCVLVDPDKFNEKHSEEFLSSIPESATHIFVGGSTVEANKTDKTVEAIRQFSELPIILFPGDHSQITEKADALLFLSLLSGRNPEYLIEQQVKSVNKLKNSNLEVIPTGYILIDGGRESAVQRISNTLPIPQNHIELIVNTALAGQYSGKKLIYLEAGSGAFNHVSLQIIKEVSNQISIPLIVGGGIRSIHQLTAIVEAGADIAVIGTAFETGSFSN